METMLKNLIKEAVLEALAEFSNGTATMAIDKGGNNVGAGANSGGTPGKGNKPKPDVGVGVWSGR